LCLWWTFIYKDQEREDMTQRLRVVLAEDHPIFREGLRALVVSGMGYEVVGEAEDGLNVVDLCRTCVPNLVLMDLSLPRMNGIEASERIKSLCPETKILVLTVHMDEEYIAAAFQAGVDGYVLKDANRSEIIAAISAVVAGKPYLSPGVSEKVIRGFLRVSPGKSEEEAASGLTPRELEVLKLVAEGHTNRSVADLLFISVKTVEKHRASLMGKLDLHSPQALTAYALEKGLIGHWSA
jgi:DNA-binding NarL/FixJ family response regulator